MTISDSELLLSDFARAGIPSTVSLRVWVLSGADPVVAEIEESSPGLLATTQSPQTAELVLLCGPEAATLDAAAVEEHIRGAARASLCMIDLVAGATNFPRRLAGITATAKKYGFDVLNLRAVPGPRGRAAESKSCRVTFLRAEAAQANSAEDVGRRALLLDAFGLGSASRSYLARASQALMPGLMDGAYFRQGRLDGWGPIHPSNTFASPDGARATGSGWNREEFPVLISIHLQTNQPDNIVRFFDRIANSCDDPGRIEVIVKIDDDHKELNEILPREVEQQPFRLKYISTPLVGGFFALWESMNDMLAITDPGAYFLLNLNDEMYFTDRGWDTRIERYVGAFPDHLFRLRTSIYRYRNYHDHWECGFAPETSAVTTKRWIETGGNWNPCLGPDTFQQCVAYYFNLINRQVTQPRYREIPIDDIRFGGEGAYIGLAGKALRRRIRGAARAWYRLMSPEIQQDAARRAAKIHATIEADKLRLDASALRIDEVRRNVIVMDKDGVSQLASFSFKISKNWYRRVNAIRALQFAMYGGGGEQARRGHISAAAIFLAYRYDFAEKIREWVFEQPPPLGVDGAAIKVSERLARVPYILARPIYYGVHARRYAHTRWCRDQARMLWHALDRRLIGYFLHPVRTLKRAMALLRRKAD